MKHIIKNHKRGLSVLMMLFLLFVISGCGEQKTDMAVGDTITIEYSWWGDDSRNQYTLDAVDIFEKENPEIKKTKTNINEKITFDKLNDKYFSIKECLSRCGNVVIDISDKKMAEKILYSFLNSRKDLLEN